MHQVWVPHTQVFLCYRYDNYRKITDLLYLGSLPFASDVAALKRQGITHVVNMCAEWSGPTYVVRVVVESAPACDYD